ncbi:MAG: divergent polysaccharide deacetylase family protein [Desulfovibrionaceae bacterium]|nr:divergent polysaccharide deacetylase family protein [Desulfovibrionaceae bacterium]
MGVFLVCFAALLFLIADLLSTPAGPQGPEKNDPGQILYEEGPGQELDDKVRQTDFALIKALKAAGVDAEDLGLVDVQVRRRQGKTYHFQTIEVPAKGRAQEILNALSEAVAEHVPGALLVPETQTTACLSIDGVPTHRIVLDGGIKARTAPAGPGPVLAVVIDDLGEDAEFGRCLAALEVPVSFSIWPYASQSEKVADIAAAAGREILVHLPMQPKGYPQVKPGPGAVFVDMDAREIGRVVDQDLSRIKGAVGANNHMGSLFTENRPAMRAALSAVNARGLFFLDSLTTQRSVAGSVARSLGMRFFRRDVFLDNVRDVQAILYQLRKAERLAKKTGSAIAIGHPHPETLAALRIWTGRRDRDVSVAPVSSLDKK